MVDVRPFDQATGGPSMIFIVVKFPIRPEHADEWPTIVDDFTRATRSEPGCLWFDWSRSLADPTEYVLVEAFRDGEAGGAHVTSDHFKQAQRTLPSYLAAVPKIINVTVDQDDWSRLAEFAGTD
jgi:quinol monooxygenase YgiN